MQPDKSLIGWYYKRDGRRIGPISLNKVQHLLATGQLQPSEMLIEIAEVNSEAGPTTKYSYVDAASAVKRRAPANSESMHQSTAVRRSGPGPSQLSQGDGWL